MLFRLVSTTCGSAVKDQRSSTFSVTSVNLVYVRTSDIRLVILQANCVVWVEGPSDRIYLKHWIEAVTSELIEGLHYSIMFYGGRLLSRFPPRMTMLLILFR